MSRTPGTHPWRGQKGDSNSITSNPRFWEEPVPGYSIISGQSRDLEN